MYPEGFCFYVPMVSTSRYCEACSRYRPRICSSVPSVRICARTAFSWLSSPRLSFFAKAMPQAGDQQRFFEDAELHKIVLHVLQDGRFMGSDGIHVAAGQHRILHAAVFDAEHIDRLRMRGSEPLRKISSGLPAALHGDGLSGKVAECPDAAVGIHCNHLTAHHVGPPPSGISPRVHPWKSSPRYSRWCRFPPDLFFAPNRSVQTGQRTPCGGMLRWQSPRRSRRECRHCLDKYRGG